MSIAIKVLLTFILLTIYVPSGYFIFKGIRQAFRKKDWADAFALYVMFVLASLLHLIFAAMLWSF